MPVDYVAVRAAIKETLKDPSHDDGSWGPVYIRLAWHTSGTYSIFDRTGGSNGATMRFEPECKWGANNGLTKARERLEPLQKKFGISHGDLWTLAGVVAVEAMGGPQVPWRSGRVDDKDNSRTVPDGRLPDAARGEDHVRAIFYRMGFCDQEIVALTGAHTVGRCHAKNSGYEGPWTANPIKFSNLYFKTLLAENWTEKKWSGPLQYQDGSGDLMMLPAELVFLKDPDFRKWVEIYAKDGHRFANDFADAFSKLLELGCDGFVNGRCPRSKL